MRFTRVTLFLIALIFVLGFYQLTKLFLAEVEPNTFQATEEVMVDASHLLAELVEDEMSRNALDTTKLREVFKGAHSREFEAQIYAHLKKRVGLNAYLTDANGIVIFDSDNGKREGENYAKRRDVNFTLRGLYGARSSREDPNNAFTSILYVAAPVGDPKQPYGVLTVYKPQADALPMIQEHRKLITRACFLIGGGILTLIIIVFLWLFRPIGKITEYARAIERGERPPLPKIGIGREVNTLSHALESMRQALEGRHFAERYIRTLTHELKSPLAGIRGAAELLDENMPAEDRKRFLGNIRAETARAERLINRLVELAALESKSHLDAPLLIDVRDVIQQAIDQAKPLADLRHIVLAIDLPDIPVTIKGDAFILRAAITNLMENAIDFSPEKEEVTITLEIMENEAVLRIRDIGPGIPDYARERVFERFFSLRHQTTAGRKGTGLGLPLVKEVAELHQGHVGFTCPQTGGTVFELRLPLAF